MSNEQVERVARALFEWDIHEHSDPKPTWDDSEGMREMFMSGATVAIAAMTPTPQVVDSTCTCPSGDGSLRWPCPQHPPTPQVVETVAELEALPVGTVLRSFMGQVCVRSLDGILLAGYYGSLTLHNVDLPATVLYPHSTPDAETGDQR